MKKFRVGLSIFLALVLIVSFVGCGGNGGTNDTPNENESKDTSEKPDDKKDTADEKKKSQDKIVIKYGHNYAIDHPAELAGQRMAELLDEKTDGRIVLETYPSMQLGASRELMTGLMNGTVEMAITSTFGTVEKKMLIAGMPYLFKDWEHVRKFRESEYAEELLRTLDSQNVHALGFWSVGFRAIGNTKREVKTPEDLKGLLIRAFENEMLTDTLTALGVNTTVLPFGEVYVALQTGAIDGEENPFTNTYTMKFHESEKYKTETRHMHNFDILAVSKKLWDSLSDEDKKILEEVATEGTEYYNELTEETEKSFKQKLIDEGVTITPIDDYQPWIDKVKPVYEKWEPIFGKELIENIRGLGW